MIKRLVRRHLVNFEPYRSARSEALSATVYLDANELPVQSSASSSNGVALNRYPDPFQIRLRAKLAEYAQLSPENIFVGSGSDEVIDLLFRLFCEPSDDSVVIFEPTYGVYRVCADLHGVQVRAVQLDDQFDIPADLPLAGPPLEETGRDDKLLFCCSPNNPTGNLLSPERITTLCASFKGIVVVDQAYGEFADDPGADLSRRVPDYPNLVVLKTLSKAWGLAGARIGFCAAHAEIIDYLLKIKAPYNINAVSSHIALHTLPFEQAMRQTVESIRRERREVSDALARLPSVTRVYPSDANFLLVEFADRDRVFRHLFDAGILVRRRSEERLRNCLRITIGTNEENSRLISCLKEIR